jgi:hypothetical protein
MLLLADGVRLFEPARDAAIEFIFRMNGAIRDPQFSDL